MSEEGFDSSLNLPLCECVLVQPESDKGGYAAIES